MLTSQWRPTRDLKFRDMGDNLMLVEFDEKLDKERVKRNSPWTFDKHLVLLLDFEGELQL